MAVELDIIRLFDSNLRGFFTINAIAQGLDKAYPFVHRKVHGLIELGVLRSVQVGKSHCCTVNLKNRRAILYLTELELEKRAKLPEALQQTAKQLESDGTLLLETVFYGNGELYAIAAGTHGKSPVAGATTISPERFKELLLTTELFKEHIVLHGYERFFAYLASLQTELDGVYNPLTVRA